VVATTFGFVIVFDLVIFAGTLNSDSVSFTAEIGGALRFLFDLAAARAARRLSRRISWISLGGLMGRIDVDNVGSKKIPQLGHDTVPFFSVTGFASSGCSFSFSTVAAVAGPLVRFGIIPRMEDSLNTHPHGLKAMNGTVPDISLNESGQTKGDLDGMWFVVVAVGAVYSGLGNKFSVRRSYLSAGTLMSRT